MPNPCGPGKNHCLISPTFQAEGIPEEDLFSRCRFLDENLENVDCSVESETRDYVGEYLCPILSDLLSVAAEYVGRSDVVLEFGGRYATTTCAIARKLNNSGLHENQSSGLLHRKAGVCRVGSKGMDSARGKRDYSFHTL